MDLQLKGKTAVVTGASRGIGRAIAETFADEGANVAICARNAEQVAEVVKGLEARGVKAWGRSVDIADGDALKAFVRQAGGELGGVDILVSSASALVQGNEEAAWQAMFEVDVLGAVRAFDAAKPLLEAAAAKSGDACFLMIASVSAVQTDVANSYGAMKAPLIHLAKGIARENGANGIRCNVVSPGAVFFEDGVWGEVKRNNPRYYEAMLKRYPNGKMATVEEVASAAVFLASPRSSATSGINMLVDGSVSNRANY